MNHPYWSDDLAIERMNEQGIKPEVKALAEALSEEYQPYRVWGIIQAWLGDQQGE